MKSEGRKLHGSADTARERGDFLKALELLDQALLAYQEEGDNLGFAEVFSSKFLTYRHLFEKTSDKNYLILAKYAAMASVELAQKSKQRQAMALPLFNLAKAHETLGEQAEATHRYKEAVASMIDNPPSMHDRPGVLLDIKVHLFTSEYKSGDKTALRRSEDALAELEQTDEPEYNKHVWVSGGHMRIAEMLKDDNLEKAKEHLKRAKEIIDSDPKLKLRLAQWEKLASRLQD